MRDIQRIIVHHSASPLWTTIDDIRKWHRERGFGDIGYHVVIHEDGSRHIGRSFHLPGAHSRGHNMDSIGVCVVGDNTKPESEWNTSQLEALGASIFALRVLFGEHLAVLGHGEVRNTLCPGVDLQEIGLV